MKTFYRVVATSFFLVCFLLGTYAQNNLPVIPYIEVRASATRKVTPDELYLKITIKESDYKGKKDLSEIQALMVYILKKNGVNVNEDLRVLSMGSSVKLKNFSSRIRTQTEAVYVLKLTDAEIMQKIIANLERNDISNIILTETKYSRIKELESELSVEAVKQAKQRALELVAAIGQEIGKAIYINSWSMNEVVSPRNYKMRGARSAVEEMEDGVDFSSVPLAITDNEYSVDVNVRFELK